MAFSVMNWRQAFVALRHRNFRLFFAGQLVSLTGTWMQSTAEGWLVYQLTGSKLLLGVVAAVGTLPMLFFSLWGGSLADRHPKRTILVITQIGMMLLAFVMTALVACRVVLPWHIVVAAALGGLAMAFDMPARQAFIVEMTSKADLLNAISLNSSVFNAARVVGPALAGVVMAKTGMAWCFFLNGVSFMAVIAGLLAMRLPAHPRAVDHVSTWRHALDGLSYVWRHRESRVLFALFGVVGVFGWSYTVLMPAFARDILHAGEDKFGSLLSANGLGALFGALTVAATGQLWRRRTLLVVGLVLVSSMLLCLALTRDYHAALVSLIVGGFGMMMFFATLNTALQSSVADGMRGRVMGVWALMFGTMMPVGSMEAGTLAHYFGLPVTLMTGAIVCALTAMVAGFVISRETEG